MHTGLNLGHVNVGLDTDHKFQPNHPYCILSAAPGVLRCSADLNVRHLCMVAHISRRNCNGTLRHGRLCLIGRQIAVTVGKCIIYFVAIMTYSSQQLHVDANTLLTLEMNCYIIWLQILHGLKSYCCDNSEEM